MTGPTIVSRYVADREYVVCPNCDGDLEESGYCFACEDYAPEALWDDVAGRIDVTYQTFGGAQRWATAERSPDGRWIPVEVRDRPPFPRLCIVGNEPS